MDAALVDTNILVYAHQPGEKSKHQRALHLLKTLEVTRAGRLSAQVLAELVSVAIRPQRRLLQIDEAYQQVERFTRYWPVFDVTPLVVLEAVRGVRDHRLSYWDAQVWATARVNGVPVVLSEDFADGRTVEGVRFLDPFLPSFNIDQLIAE